MPHTMFIETIQVSEGVFCNLEVHARRMAETVSQFYGQDFLLRLSPESIPEHLRTGRVKCRILYDREIREIVYTPYAFRPIHTLKLVYADDIHYDFKSTDREQLDDLLKQKGSADEVLIVRNGLITDTSFSNVVFESAEGLFTPTSYLLNGTRRRTLLSEGCICEREIGISDLAHYHKIYLINAMMDIKDNVFLPVSAIF